MKIFGRQVRLRAEAPLALSASVDDVLDAFYEDFATMDSGRYWWWTQMMLLEPNELIVNDGYDDLYRMAFTISDNGPGNEPDVVFGELIPVRLEPVDTTILEDAGDQVAASSFKSELVAAAVAGITSVRGPERVAASYKSREESRPNAKKEDEQVRDHMKRLRAKLGLADDVPDERVLELAATRLESDGGGEIEHEVEPKEGEETPEPTPATPAEKEAAEPEEPGTTKEVGPQAKTVSAEALAELQAEARMGREAREEQLRTSDEAFVDAAIGNGKLPGRSRESTLKRMGRSPEARAEERAFIEELDENVIPVELRGRGDGGEQTNGSNGQGNLAPALSAWAEQHMPDAIERRRTIEARRASGERHRVLTDA